MYLYFKRLLMLVTQLEKPFAQMEGITSKFPYDPKVKRLSYELPGSTRYGREHTCTSASATVMQRTDTSNLLGGVGDVTWKRSVLDQADWMAFLELGHTCGRVARHIRRYLGHTKGNGSTRAERHSKTLCNIVDSLSHDLLHVSIVVRADERVHQTDEIHNVRITIGKMRAWMETRVVQSIEEPFAWAFA